jgi:hypothetical protein
MSMAEDTSQDEVRPFLRVRTEREQESRAPVAAANLVDVLRAIPTLERESRIFEALAQIAEQELRKHLLEKAGEMPTEELERRLA